MVVVLSRGLRVFPSSTFFVDTLEAVQKIMILLRIIWVGGCEGSDGYDKTHLYKLRRTHRRAVVAVVVVAVAGRGRGVRGAAAVTTATAATTATTTAATATTTATMHACVCVCVCGGKVGNVGKALILNIGVFLRF